MYERALERKPQDAALITRIGMLVLTLGFMQCDLPAEYLLYSLTARALMSTHDYARAIEYFERAARLDGGQVAVFQELSDLYLLLKQWDKVGVR